ncbi:ectoine hydroxylase [Actinomycetospora cinnamomea]|uniref:Ectoine hydroxylase n=1 Tax=Actinomycetospora cinnamomea TaxID=663609 RepID=A0A2U1F0R3_9PSEU|nr:ectoine hydroxylase [Actinomycetospora cinnamomea]PVZ05765.1 ectoine hydroxylase [Actinomycetospora cinnamomea]
MTAPTTTAGRTDAYPTRGETAAAILDRPDPVLWAGPDAPGPASREELLAYERDGVLTVDALLTADEVAAVGGELERLGRDEALRRDDRTILEKHSGAVRSVFEVHRLSEVVARLVADERLAGRARQILGSAVYVHQSRINFKPGLGGGGFSWHSDFETWHAEDGMPRPRALSVSVALTENLTVNGPLMVMPGSHRRFVSCVGETPPEHFRESLRDQEIGVPDEGSLTRLAVDHGIVPCTGPAGSATWFDSNTMHGSSDNITPFPRSNLFVVFASTDDPPGEPYAAPAPRPSYIAATDLTPV